MSRTPFDQFSKQYLEELLTPLGQVEISREVPGESRFIDVWFAPDPRSVANGPTLSLLGRMASLPCLFEPFRNPPSLDEVRSCLLKLMYSVSDWQRRARRQEQGRTSSELPFLWIVTPSASTNWLNSLGAQPRESWPAGVYVGAEVLRTGIVVINQLRKEEETLWLRLLGKGKIQQQAIEEVISLPSADPKREEALKLLASWKIMIESSKEIESEEQQLIMTLSPAYLEWERRTKEEGLQQGLNQGLQEGLEQGLQQGLQQDRQRTVASLLKMRFGELDSQLNNVIQFMLKLTPEEYAQQLPLLLSLSQEELIRRYH